LAHACALAGPAFSLVAVRQLNMWAPKPFHASPVGWPVNCLRVRNRKGAMCNPAWRHFVVWRPDPGWLDRLRRAV